MRLRSLFILMGPLIGMLATAPLKAQQDDETKYLIAGGAALGAVVSYNAYRQSPTCLGNFGGDSTQFANGCTNREQVKTLFGIAALLCATVSVIELLRAVHLMAFRPGALITLAPHTTPALRPPNLAYDMSRHEVRAVLVHAAF